MKTFYVEAKRTEEDNNTYILILEGDTGNNRYVHMKNLKFREITDKIITLINEEKPNQIFINKRGMSLGIEDELKRYSDTMFSFGFIIRENGIIDYKEQEAKKIKNGKNVRYILNFPKTYTQDEINKVNKTFENQLIKGDKILNLPQDVYVKTIVV